MSKDEQGRNWAEESGEGGTFEQQLSRAVSGQALDIIVGGYRDWALSYSRDTHDVLEDIYEKHDIPPGPIMELVSLYFHAPGADSLQLEKKSKEIKRLNNKLREHWEKVTKYFDTVEPLNKKQGTPLEFPSQTVGEIDYFIRNWLTLYNFSLISDLVWSLAELFLERTGKTLNRSVADLTVAAFPDWLPEKPGEGADYWERVENAIGHILTRRRNNKT